MNNLNKKNIIKKSYGIIAISMISIVFIFSIKSDIEKEAINQIKEVNFQIAQRIDENIKNIYWNLNYLNKYINSIKDTYGDGYDSKRTLKGINDKESGSLFDDVGIVDKDGNLDLGYTKVYVGDRKYFKEGMQGKNYISRVITGRHNNKKMIAYSKPLLSENDRVEGVLVGFFNYENVKKMLDIDIYSGGGQSYIVNKEGSLIIGDEEEFIKNKEQIIDSKQNQNSNGKYKSIYENGGTYFSYEEIKSNSGWFVLSEVSIEQVFKHLNGIMNTSILVIILFVTIYIINDFKKYKINSKKILKAKYIDGLTGIPNKEMFKIEIQKIINENKNKKYLLISLDIISFKFINQTMGHEKANVILKKIAENIKKIPNVEMISRINNDIFGIVIEYTEGLDISKEIDNIKSYMVNNDVIESVKHNIELNIGITSIKNGDSIEQKIDEMHLARIECKKHNELKYYFYDERLENIKTKVLVIENELESALENGEFKILYQPKVGSKTKEIVGVEALTRWISKKYGFVSPAEFIPVAERNGNIHLIGDWVLEEVCKLIKQSMDNNEEIVPISINVSRVELYRTDFIENIAQKIKQYDVDTKYLEFEITETMALNDFEYMNEKIRKIKELGIKVSMDDFGTGSSTLSNLKNIEIDILKIDRSILLDIEESKKTKTLVSNIIDIAKEFGFSVVCEGVETMEQVEILEKIDCDIIQGYVFSKPVEWLEVKKEWLIKK